MRRCRPDASSIHRNTGGRARIAGFFLPPQGPLMPISHPFPLRRTLAMLLVLPCTLVSGQQTSATAQMFVGTVVYEASAGGSNTDGADLFNSWAPKREAVTWGSGGRLRLEATGGLMEGIIVARIADSAFFSLDTVAGTARAAVLSSMNPEDIEPEVMALLQNRFDYPQVERTDEEATYAGHRCRMYIVRRSGALRRGATARACVAEDIHVRPTSYSFEWNDRARTVMASLPVAFNIREGLPLMLEVNEDNTIVTYRAVSIIPREPADSLFSVPAGYTILTGPPDESEN
jgi:hypothetical protein